MSDEKDADKLPANIPNRTSTMVKIVFKSGGCSRMRIYHEPKCKLPSELEYIDESTAESFGVDVIWIVAEKFFNVFGVHLLDYHRSPCGYMSTVWRARTYLFLRSPSYRFAIIDSYLFGVAYPHEDIPADDSRQSVDRSPEIADLP